MKGRYPLIDHFVNGIADHQLRGTFYDLIDQVRDHESDDRDRAIELLEEAAALLGIEL